MLSNSEVQAEANFSSLIHSWNRYNSHEKRREEGEENRGIERREDKNRGIEEWKRRGEERKRDDYRGVERK